MSRKLIAALVLALALPVAGTLPGAAAASAADLQVLLDAAAPGSSVTVPAGTYEGSVIVRTSIEVRGEGDVILDGLGAGSVLTIAAPDVSVSGVTVRGSGRYPVGAPSGILVEKEGDRAHLFDVRIEDSYMGITVQRAADVVIERVHIVGSGQISGELHAVTETPQGGQDADEAPAELRGDGIWLFDSHRTIVRDSVIETVRDGVQLTYGTDALLEDNVVLDSRYALHDMYAAGPTMRGNQLRGNLSGIVLMYGGPVLVEANTITESGSASTGFGVLVKDAGDVLLQDNVIADNRIGLHVDDAGRTGGEPAHVHRNTIAMNQVGVLLYPSADAVFWGNGFVENTTQVALGGQGFAQAVWVVDGEGNYWSDYGGFDAGGDGKGDLAYTRSGRVSRMIAENPLLLALASGPAFRLLSAVEDKWVPAEPLVLDDAPLTTIASPPLQVDRAGTAVPLWLPGGAMLWLCAWLLMRGRRGVRTHA